MVASYKDTAEAKKVDERTHVKKVQSEGFHIGASRYVTIKADDRSLYGKKVCSEPERHVSTALLIAVLAGERRSSYRQDNASHPGCTLSRNCSAWRGGQHGGTTWRLLDQRWLLETILSMFECCTLLACRSECRVAG